MKMSWNFSFSSLGSIPLIDQEDSRFSFKILFEEFYSNVRKGWNYVWKHPKEVVKLAGSTVLLASYGYKKLFESGNNTLAEDSLVLKGGSVLEKYSIPYTFLFNSINSDIVFSSLAIGYGLQEASRINGFYTQFPVLLTGMVYWNIQGCEAIRPFLPNANVIATNEFSIQQMEEALKRHNFFDALSFCKEMINSKQATSDVHYYYGMMLKLLGRYQDAIKSFKEAMKLGHPGAQTAYELMIATTDTIEMRRSFLSEIGMEVPSDYIYIVMSVLAYQAVDILENCMKGFALKDTREHLLEHCKNLSDNGWIIDKQNLMVDGGSSYFGIPFVNSKKKQLIIAHRGMHIDNLNELENALKIIQGGHPDKYAQAKSFTEKLSSLYSDHIVSHTGHFLGAVLAELLAYDRNEIAITCDSPGIDGIIDNQNVNVCSGVKDASIISYLSTPNVVNTYNIHVGKLRTVAIDDKHHGYSLRLMRAKDLAFKEAIRAGKEVVIIKEGDRFTILGKCPENSDIIRFTCSEELKKELGFLDFSTDGSSKILTKGKNTEKIYQLVSKEMTSKKSCIQSKSNKDPVSSYSYFNLSYAYEVVKDGVSWLFATRPKKPSTDIVDRGYSLRLIFAADSVSNKAVREGKEIVIIKGDDQFTILCKHLQNNDIVRLTCSEELRKELDSLDFGTDGSSKILTKSKNTEKIYQLISKEVTSKKGYIADNRIISEQVYSVLDAFNPKIGFPHSNDYRIIVKWPHGLDEMKNFQTVCKEYKLPYKKPYTVKDKIAQESLKQVGYYVEAETVSRLNLLQFSEPVQKFLKNWKESKKYLGNFDLRIMRLHHIEENEVVIDSDPFLFTAEDFRSYVEYKYIESEKFPMPSVDNPFYICCKPKKQQKDMPKLWFEYNLFFQLPSIQALSDHIPILKSFLTEDAKEKFDIYLKSLDVDIEKKIETELSYQESENAKDWNYITIVDQLFDTKPNLKESLFIDIMSNEKDFFLEKAMQIRNHDLPILRSTKITDFKRDCRDLQFTLADGSTVTVALEDTCQVTGVLLITKKIGSFLSYMNNTTLQDVFDLKIDTEGNIPSWVHSGKYTVSSTRQQSSKKIFTIIEKDLNSDLHLEIEYKGMHIHSARITNVKTGEKFNELHSLIRFLSVEYAFYFQIPIVSSKLGKSQDINKVVLLSAHIVDTISDYKQKVRDLSKTLISEVCKNITYLDRVIDHFIQNKFSPVENQFILEDEYFKILEKNIIIPLQKYYKALNVPKNISSILEEAIYEANYQRFVKYLEKISISETMKLLTRSIVYLESIKMKEIVLFVGNTGSGKSTAIAFLLGYKLFTGENAARQKIWSVASNEKGNFPKIGHALTTSETLYAQGYNNTNDPKKNLTLVDTPGFGENRGLIEQLCAALSIDQAIQQSKAIKALVITIPFSYFFETRANQLINLIKEVANILPDIFNQNQRIAQEVLKSVYVLVTKEGIVSKLQFENLLKQMSSEPNQSKERQIIWEILISINDGRRLNLVQISNKVAYQNHWTQYLDSPGISPDYFKSVIQTSEMKNILGNTVQYAAATWHKSILQTYVKLRHLMDGMSISIDQHEKTIADLKKEIAKIEELLTNLQGVDVNINSGVLLSEELAIQFKQFKEGCVDSMNFYESQILEYRKKLEELNEARMSLEITCLKIKQKRNDISSGNSEVLLWTQKSTPGSVMNYCHLKSGAQEKAYMANRATTKEDCLNEEYDQSVIVEQYKGQMSHDFRIDKNYLLAPENPEHQATFIEKGIVDDGNYQYKAIVKGEHWRLDPRFKIKILESGRSILYSFITDWDPSHNLPWFEVIHEVPNFEYHRTTLDNLLVEQTECEGKLTSLIADFNHTKEQLERWENSKKETTEHCPSDRNSLISSFKTALTFQKNALTNSTHSAEEEKRKLRELKDSRKKLSVVIKTRWSTAIAVNELCNIVAPIKKEVDSKVRSGGKEGDFMETCNGYQKFFQNHHTEILEQWCLSGKAA